jgi:hypothetical protein
MERKPGKHATPIHSALTALVLGAYVGSYYWLADRDTSELELNGLPAYRYPAMHFIFAPMHWCDRCLRPDYWIDSDSPIPL